MLVNGCDCSIVIKTSHCEIDIPYSEETIRETVSVLQEEAAIEGDGTCKAIRKNSGFTGCVVAPLTLGTAPLLLYLAMGAVGKPVFVSETRNLFKYSLCLLPLEDCDCFDLVQDRGGERKLYEGCGVTGFELRFLRCEAVKLKLDICGERSPRVYPYTDSFEKKNEERFISDFTSYWINSKEYKNIYGVTLSCKKDGGTKTKLWIKRVLNEGDDLPSSIEEFIISAQLLKDSYEYRHFGTFHITLKRLVLVSDETNVNSIDAVIGPLRFYVAGTVTTEVFTSGEGVIA
jgi:hypothetical protein